MDLPVRMLAAAAALTLGITAAAGRLGPVLSGIVGTYPVVSTVVTTFMHAQLGRAAAAHAAWQRAVVDRLRKLLPRHRARA